MAFSCSSNDLCSDNHKILVLEKRAKNYCRNHRILVVGEVDFSFSVSLSEAFGSGSNITATSVDSLKVLRRVCDRVVYNIEELKRKGCNVMHSVDPNSMPSHPCFKGMTFDRIIFDYQSSVMHGYRKHRREGRLIKGFLKAAKEMVCEDGEIHITHTTGVVSNLRIEFLAFQQWLELVEVVDFDVCDYSNDLDYLPSKLYKFRWPGPTQGILPLATTKPSNCSSSSEIPMNLLESISLNSVGRENVKVVGAEEKWIKHYCSSHKILIVGEGDFSFSASLASAFGSASNMTATCLNRRKFLKGYDKATYNIKELRRMGCKVLYLVDATAIANCPRFKGTTFDRIVFNFPCADISKNDTPESIICRNQILVREFLKNAKEMICESGEIHIAHRTDGDYSSWGIEAIAAQLALELVEAVDFRVTDYPGYNPKSGYGNNDNFDWFPSKTYKFRHPRPLPKTLSFPSSNTTPNINVLPNSASNFNVAQQPCIQQSFYDLYETEPNYYPHQELFAPTMYTSQHVFSFGEFNSSPFYSAHYGQSSLPSSKYCVNDNLKQNVVKTEEKWIKHYSSNHEILLVGEGDFSFSASLAMAFGSAPNVTATSLDSEDFLTTNYCKAFLHLRDLKKRGCKVLHGVDATAMAYDRRLMGSKFDRIIFNFPHAGFFTRDIPRESQIGTHQALIWKFLENAVQMIAENGEIHITHKTNGFHQKWNIIHIALQLGLEIVGIVDFKVSDYPGYSNKYGYGGDNSFDCSHSKTFMFRLPRPPVYFSWPWV